jgi:plastocyanin
MSREDGVLSAVSGQLASPMAREVVPRWFLRVLSCALLALSAAAIVLAQPHSANATTHDVAIDGAPNCGTAMFCYNPSSLTVTVGDSVTWVNNSVASHTVTGCHPSACLGNGPHGGDRRGLSSPKIDASGGTFSFTFARPGTYNYYSAVDSYAVMHGTITVVPVATTTTTAASTTSTTAATPRAPNSRAPAATTPQSANAATVPVAIQNSGACGQIFCFSPQTLTVTSGTQVTWTNMTSVGHTVTRCTTGACPVGAGTGTDAAFGSGDFGAGQTFSVTFQNVGTYIYYCQIHGYPVMHGTITVVAATTPTTVSTTPTTVGSGTTTATTVSMTTSSQSGSSAGTTPFGTSTDQLAGTGAPASQWVAVSLVLLLLGLGLMAASSRRRRPHPERTGGTRPETSLIIRSSEDFEAG